MRDHALRNACCTEGVCIHAVYVLNPCVSRGAPCVLLVQNKRASAAALRQ